MSQISNDQMYSDPQRLQGSSLDDFRQESFEMSSIRDIGMSSMQHPLYEPVVRMPPETGSKFTP